MFPNKSSSYEISSKTNAFVQIKEDVCESMRGMAQPFKFAGPLLQVPEKRDVMVVDEGVAAVDPSLTVIANHPSQAPFKILSPPQNGDSESEGSSRMPQAEGGLCVSDSPKDSNTNYNVRVKDNLNKSYLSQSSSLSYIPQTNDVADNLESFKICDYYSRWGIPRCLKLRGGGESSLTTGTAGWGTPPVSQSGGSSGWNSSSGGNNTGNNSGAGNQSGGSGAGGQVQSQSGASGAGQQWGTGTNNNNSGGARGGTGSSASGGGPPSQSTAPTGGVAPSSSAVSGSTAPPPTSTSNNNNTTGGQQAGQAGSTGQNGAGGSGQTGSGQQAGGGGGTGSWAAAAGKGLPPPANGATLATTSGGQTSTKAQMEQLNTMREALYSQDGWGGQNVNQDSNWDIPGSPEPGSKDNNNAATVPLWKLPINNVSQSRVLGTDLWEANLRNGGLPPPQTPSQKTSWHTPTSNFGGTWGEDDEGDASNVWNGVPPAAPPSTGPQWPTQPPPIWPGAKKEREQWGGPNWSDQRGDPREQLRHGDMRQMMDTREHMRPATIDHRSMSGNDLMGGSGRLNGVTTDPMWPGPTPHHHISHHQGKLPPQPTQPGVNQWSGGGGGGPPLKEMAGLVGPKTTGWEEPSPPAQRRNMPNYDDGTSLWGPQHTRPTLQGQNKVSHWKEMATPGMGRGGLQCPPTRANPNPNIKPDQPLWPHHPRNGGGWAEAGMDGSGGGGGVGGPWLGDEKAGGGGAGVAPWMEPAGLTPSWQTAAPAPKHKPAWEPSPPDLDPASWVHAKQPSKNISKEFIWTSKQFRILTEMGFKKEEVEAALRNSGMSLEDALDQLNTARGDRWRHSDLDPDHPAAALISPFPSPQQAICIPFATSGGGSSGAGGPGGAGGPTLATISPAVMQKLLSQQPPQQQPFPQQSSRTQQSQQPSPQQLRILVQQIQMAVQSGYLSPQILNQSLAPQTLLLLNQLLQQIKHLQQLGQHHAVMQVNPLGKPSSNQILQLSVQITKTKQQIANLQNQIAAQQAVYVKHQQQTPPTSDFFKTNPLHEPSISSIHPNFSELTLKEPQNVATSQQSRLTQWKLPAPEKDQDLTGGGEFSRAPGTTAKSAQGSSSPNTNLLLSQDGTWSSVNRESGWPDTSGDDTSSKDWPNSSQPPSQAFSDLVPEFEPGKPWKGNPLKSIEDDPNVTPGMVRSPLSLSSIKDSHILSSSAGKASPTTSSAPSDIFPSLSLSSSSTWSFNPPPAASNNSMFASMKLNSGGSGGNSNSKTNSSTWGESDTSELWAPSKRGPPPGLPAKPAAGGSGGGSQAANGWGAALSGAGGGRWSGGSAGWPGSNQPAATPTGSTWLLLRNLTPQIDGSTLKTLCLQHGPLQNFHLYLNHGIALAKYTSREEANKAQGALNNCVLGNTTIFAESHGDSDVLTLLQHLGGQGGGSGGSGWRGKESWTNSGLWGGSGGGAGGGGSLWAGSEDPHRNTPSSINSFLPGDLLGGESI